MTDSLLHIFAINSAKTIWIKQAINGRLLKQNIRKMHLALSNYSLLSANPKDAYSNYIQWAHWFYDNTLDAVLKEYQGIENLIIIPDGELAHLPFEVFLTKPAPQELDTVQTAPLS